MTAVAERVRLAFSPMQFSDTRADVRLDLAVALPPTHVAGAPHVVTFSEAAANRRPDRHVRPELEDMAAERGWHLVVNRSDAAFAVNPLLCTVEAEGYEHVLDPRRVKPGAYTARGVAWVRVRTLAGNLVTLFSAHLLTAWDEDPIPGPEGRREVNNLTLTTRLMEFGEAATELEDGTGVAFFVGDVNAPDGPGTGIDPDNIYAALDRAGFVTCWDDAEAWPATHGRRGKPIDITARNRRDKRVTFVRANVGPLRRSDHQQHQAAYDIAPLPVPEVPERPARHECPVCGRMHRPRPATVAGP